MRLSIKMGLIGLAMIYARPGFAEKNYGPGVSDTEIKIGQTMPFSGPASSFALAGKTQAAYLKMINEKGGINGRQINLIALDDAFSPPKAVEQTRKLVEGEEVLAIYGTIGTAINLAIAKYLNTSKVPQILVSTASSKMNDPANLPWTTAFYMPADNEAAVYAKWLLQNKPKAKIAILYQNDDFGKGYLDGFKRELGDKAAAMIVKEVSYDLASPTVDSQVLQLQASGADVFFSASFPKFAAQALKKSTELGWKPLHVIVNAAAPIIVRMDQVGNENAAGVISAMYTKDLNDTRWNNEQTTKDYRAFVSRYLPGEQANNISVETGYASAELLVDILRRCGDNLTRENLMKMSTNIEDVQLSMFIPGVKINVSSQDRSAWKKVQMMKFDGKEWTPEGELIGN